MCAIKCIAQYLRMMSTGRAQMRGKPFIIKTYLCPFLFHPAGIILIEDTYFYIILIQLLEKEGKASAASKHDPPAKWLPFRTKFS